MKPCRLLYRSIAQPKTLTEESLSRLSNRAASVNRQLGICGILAVSDGRFLQVIEGVPKFINKVYAKIIQDKRHHDVELISYEGIVQTEFQDWDMKLFQLDALEKPIKDLFNSKYPVVDNKIQFIDDAVLMTSLLMDIKHLSKS